MNYSRPLVNLVFSFCLLAVVAIPVHALDLSGGLMRAVPVPQAGAPVIDGDLKDWDLSAVEDVWIADETADRFRASIAAMYDDEGLYLAAKVRLPGRPLRNPHSPVDSFWIGDCLQFRFVTDPRIGYPASPAALAGSPQVIHLSAWKDTLGGRDYIKIQKGIKFDQGESVNPAGSAVVIREGADDYVMEIRIPWSALGAINGKNPFGPGGKMTFVAEVLWDHTTLRTAAIYRQPPGVFAFKNSVEWGQLEFSPAGKLAPRHEGMDAHLKRLAATKAESGGVPIKLTLEKPAKVSLNIVDASGAVLREITGGELRAAGEQVWRWDGLDQWGEPLAPGSYRWAAYLSPGLKAKWMGSVGSSGNPPYPTEDGRGGWGADHGDPVDVAADESGLYFLWMLAEEGAALVKTDFAGNVIWRRTPFVGGGFGPFHHVATNGRHVFFTFGMKPTLLGRMDAESGKLLTWPDGTTLLPLSDAEPLQGPAGAFPFAPASAGGLAASEREVFASVPSENRIRVLDAETGSEIRFIDMPAPRGVALDGKGDLYAISAPSEAKASVLRFTGTEGVPRVVVDDGLVSPWDVAVDAAGAIHVTDAGGSQQVKVFAATGEPVRVLGKEGGRSWAGKYDTESFRNPSGISADPRGGILVAESSLPKPISRFDARDGKLIQRWFGGTAYAPTNIPDPEDPRVNYYSLSSDPKMLSGGGFARARIPEAGGTGFPDAYWNLPYAGFPAAGVLLDTMSVPEITVADNGRKYLICDISSVTQSHGIAEIRGDEIVPVAHARVALKQSDRRAIEFWRDVNGDGQIQEAELTRLDSIKGEPLVEIATTAGSMWMAPSGDLFFTTQANRILKVPSLEFSEGGVPRWDLAGAFYVVPSVLSRAGGRMPTNWREGLLGIRTDTAGNLYTCFNTVVPYATEALTRSMQEGIGHTSRSNAVKFAKFDPQGRLLWTAGRKSRGAAKPGEMYHFWVLAGLVNDRYVAGGSEWGQIYFYTHDGFFVDALMSDPSLGGEAGPYTFGGETFSGRVHYFPKQDEVWAYSVGRAYKIEGFKNGIVEGEKRLTGSVVLDRIYTREQAVEEKAPLRIVARGSDVVVPARELQRNGARLATVELSYDAQRLYARFAVEQPAPFRNGADALATAFKGGDSVALRLGPSGRREQPVLGDVRLLATKIQGKPVLIAYKAITKGPKKAERYFTPAAGEALFEYVGEVPGAELSIKQSNAGYVAEFSVPLAFLEFPWRQGGLIAAEAEVLVAGQGARGLQAMSRNYLFSPMNSQTSMVDDVVTETRLYPQFWGEAHID
ncbi:MAG: FlgD immunoglobulin-like domain containing protein [Opitutaceae bacterium]